MRRESNPGLTASLHFVDYVRCSYSVRRARRSRPTLCERGAACAAVHHADCALAKRLGLAGESYRGCRQAGNSVSYRCKAASCKVFGSCLFTPVFCMAKEASMERTICFKADIESISHPWRAASGVMRLPSRTHSGCQKFVFQRAEAGGVHTINAPGPGSIHLFTGKILVSRRVKDARKILKYSVQTPVETKSPGHCARAGLVSFHKRSPFNYNKRQGWLSGCQDRCQGSSFQELEGKNKSGGEDGDGKPG